MSSFEPQVLQGLEVEQSCCSQPVGTLMWTWGHRRRSTCGHFDVDLGPPAEVGTQLHSTPLGSWHSRALGLCSFERMKHSP